MKVIISDYDNTLYLHNNMEKENILKKNVEQINLFLKNKNIFILATSRDFQGINKEIIKYNIPFNYLICNNGAEIYDSKYNLLYLKKLNEKDIPILQNMDFTFYYDYSNKNITCAKYFNYNNELISLLSTKIKESDIEIKPNKIKIYPKDVNKYKAILKITKILDNYDNIYAFGDSESDYLMLTKFKGYTLKENILNFKNTNVIGIDKIYQEIDKINKL